MTEKDIIQKIALENFTTEAEVRKEIERIAKRGFSHKDENIRYFWKNIPRKGELPSAEEIIAYFAFLAKKTKNKSLYQ